MSDQTSHVIDVDEAGFAVDVVEYSNQRPVVVDFWASWCIPCRYQNPKLIKVYNKFKEQNFKIFGVSLDRGDRGKEMWVKAILSDSLPWNQGSDLQGFESEISKNYIPTYA